MTRPPQPELFVSERPVRSDFGLEKTYARRRKITLVVLAVIMGGIIYALWGHSTSNPANIPTIKSEGSYKQKPADPGGIDIPHQDVRVYDELEGKNGPLSQVEHLLPPPETPKEVPRVVEVPPPPPLQLAPLQSTVAPTVAAMAQPKVAPSEIGLNNEHEARPITTTVAPVPVAAPLAKVVAVVPVPVAAPAPTATAQTPSVSLVVPPAPPRSATTIDQVIANTLVSSSSNSQMNSSKVAPSSGSAVVQLASAPDEAKAQAMMKDLQSKYASALGGASLHLVRADLGAKGIYYRIQSQGLAESDANHICSSLKQMNAGCILVRK